MTEKQRKPRAVKIDTLARNAAKPATEKQRQPRAQSDLARLEPVPDEAANDLVERLEPPPLPVRRRRGIGWGGLLLACLAGLLSLAGGLAVDQLVRALFERSELLGWVAAGLAAIATLTLFAIAIREIWALARLRKIDKLREQGESADRENDTALARKLLSELDSLYAARPETAHGREQLAAHRGEVMDGSDLVRLAERDLLQPLDQVARAMVMASAKRVSIVTAVSPRALVDIVYVAMENLRLIARISRLYGGRPGVLGFWRLAANVIAHLAATGAIAVGEGVVQQLIGHGLAARISAKLGEGVVNGLLTARIGISAIDICRPLKFTYEKRPAVSAFLGELATLNGFRLGDGESKAGRSDK